MGLAAFEHLKLDRERMPKISHHLAKSQCDGRSLRDRITVRHGSEFPITAIIGLAVPHRHVAAAKLDSAPIDVSGCLQYDAV
jgi:hypothetical protein